MKIASIIAIVVLVACGDRAPQMLGTHAQRERVTADLLDPLSAQFRNERSDGETLCGEINAKNSMGGYVGFRRFISTPTQHALAGQPLRDWKDFDSEMTMVALQAEERLLAQKGLTGASVFKLPQQDIQEARDLAKFKHLWMQRCESGG